MCGYSPSSSRRNLIRAILSDIHGNLEALKAVLADAAACGADEYVCLGDVVGYGPDPAPCLDLARKVCRIVLRGNHEVAVPGGDTVGMKDHVRATIDDARNDLSPGALGVGKARWNFVKHLPDRYREGDQLYVHASPRDPIHEYVLPSDCRDLPEKIREIFKLFDRIAFVGHTHVGGVFTSQPVFRHVSELAEREPVGSQKWLVNVGSVGQPRDRDPRACYLLFDGESLRFRRVTYDLEKTMHKIVHERGYDPVLAKRLADGT